MLAEGRGMEHVPLVLVAVPAVRRVLYWLCYQSNDKVREHVSLTGPLHKRCSLPFFAEAVERLRKVQTEKSASEGRRSAESTGACTCVTVCTGLNRA